METQKCELCDDLLSEGVHCTACSKVMHFHCAGITEAGYRRHGDRKLTWRCMKCKQTGAAVSPSLPRPPIGPESESAVLLEIRALSAKMTPLEGLKEDVAALRSEFADLKTSLNKQLNDIIKEFGTKIHDMEQRIVQLEKVQVHVAQLQTRVDQLVEDSEDKDQWSRLNNVEVKGIPQSNNENLFDIVTKIGQKINYPISKTQINFVTRVPTSEKDHIRPIIVSFISRYTKEDFIAASRYHTKTTPLTCSQFGFTGNHRVFINDHLTPKNKLLLSQCKKAAKEMDFRYVWVKQAKIYARKTDTSPVILVKSEKDLSKIA